MSERSDEGTGYQGSPTAITRRAAITALSVMPLSVHAAPANDTIAELIAQTYASDELVVLVMIERHAEVGDLPDQDWSLRVTEVYRKDRLEWQLVHRHADRSSIASPKLRLSSRSPRG